MNNYLIVVPRIANKTYRIALSCLSMDKRNDFTYTSFSNDLNKATSSFELSILSLGYGITNLHCLAIQCITLQTLHGYNSKRVLNFP